MGNRYQLKTATLAVVRKDGKSDLVTLPSGSLLIIKQPPVAETGRVAVEWQGMTVEMFTIDVRERGQLIEIEQRASRCLPPTMPTW